MKKQATVSTRLRRFIRGGLAALVVTGLLASPAADTTDSFFVPENNWIELGECVVDYTDWMWDWLENLIDDFVEGDWTNNLEVEHPDAYLKIFTNSTEEEQVGSTTYRGFYAQDNDFNDWWDKLWAWFWLNQRKVEYVNGNVVDTDDRDDCSVYHADNEHKSGTWLRTRAGWSKLNFDNGSSYEPNYHLFVRNCQHFTEWVLTLIDTSQ